MKPMLGDYFIKMFAGMFGLDPNLTTELIITATSGGVVQVQATFFHDDAGRVVTATFPMSAEGEQK